jgi:hypothetical protein
MNAAGLSGVHVAVIVLHKIEQFKEILTAAGLGRKDEA